MKIYIESEACLVKRCNAARGSPSAPPSFGAGPTVLTAARASPFRGFSNSTYTKSPKSHTNGHIAGSERLNSKSSSYSPRRSSSPQPRPAEERHITQIRGTPLLTTNLVKPQSARRHKERDAHGVGGTIGEGGSDDGAGGVGRAPRLDDLGGARRLRVGLDDCNRGETGGVSAT
jgi:hypothetical protein